MLLDDECQAIADLDVIFENERLDAILGSSNTLPVDTDRPLQQILGLDALEDLPSMSQGDVEFQQAMMDGCVFLVCEKGIAWSGDISRPHSHVVLEYVPIAYVTSEGKDEAIQARWWPFSDLWLGTYTHA